MTQHTPCECWHHRYGVVHTLPGDVRVYDHSQGTMDTLRERRDLEDHPSRLYEHGMSADVLRLRHAEETKSHLD